MDSHVPLVLILLKRGESIVTNHRPNPFIPYGEVLNRGKWFTNYSGLPIPYYYEIDCDKISSYFTHSFAVFLLYFLTLSNQF